MSVCKSMIVGIVMIGLFYILMFYIGFGVMMSGLFDISDSNMVVFLLVRSFNCWLFVIVLVIVFIIVLGIVSGLIIVFSGVVVYDLVCSVVNVEMNEFN